MDNSRASAFSCTGARTEGKIWDASEEINNQSNQAVARMTGRAPESPVDGAPWARVRGEKGPESPLGASLKCVSGGPRLEKERFAPSWGVVTQPEQQSTSGDNPRPSMVREKNRGACLQCTQQKPVTDH